MELEPEALQALEPGEKARLREARDLLALGRECGGGALHQSFIPDFIISSRQERYSRSARASSGVGGGGAT
jgi:hypothetical protein